MRLQERIENFWMDVRYAARGLARRPGFTAMAILTLGVGIGATTAIFSAVNALLLRPLPFARPDELMKISLIKPPRGDRPAKDDEVWSYPKFMAFRDAQHVFSDLALYADGQFTLTGVGVERIHGETISATLFRTLGVRLIRGREFDPAIDRHPGAPHEAVLSHELWQRRFSADPAIVGKTIGIDRVQYVIIGVAPQQFRGLSGQAEVFIPVTTESPENLVEPQSHSYWLVGRRAPGVSESQAVSAVTLLGTTVNDAYPNPVDKLKWGARASPLNAARIAPQIRRSLLVLFAAVGLVLLIACVNVANLLLGRASMRRREIALRLAIGASRGRLIRLLLTESLLLALIGAAAGLVVARLSVSALGTVNPATALRVTHDTGLGAVTFSSIALDWPALAFTIAVALVVGMLFGLAPALSATRSSLAGVMADARSASAGSSAVGGRRALLVAEVALALVLLAGSGLMLRSLGRLMAINTGFDSANVLTLRLGAPDIDARDSMPGFYDQLLSRVRAVPGVVEASINNCAPLGGGCNTTTIEFTDRPKMDYAQAPSVAMDWVSPGWFATMHVPLLRGRGFARSDRIGTRSVVVINDVAAKRFWPNDDPIGKPVRLGMGGPDTAIVIGIVGGVRQALDAEPRPEAYVSYQQLPQWGGIVFVRTRTAAAAFAPAIRRAMHEVAPQSPIYDIQTMDDRALAATARSRFTALLLGLFAVTALVLAAIGIYGVMALAVASRTREIGVRVALGADRLRVLRLVVGESMAIVAVGTVLGLAAALACTRALRSLLFDLAPTDPLTYGCIVALLTVTALAASWIPARRAASVDPVEALRTE
jgi:predicted permease